MAPRQAVQSRLPQRPIRQALAASFTFDILDVLATAEDGTVILDEFPPYQWSEFVSLDKNDQKVPAFPEDRYSSVFAGRLGSLPVSALRHPLGSSNLAADDSDGLPFLVTIPTEPRMKLVAKERLCLQAWLNSTASKWDPLHAPWMDASPTFPTGQWIPEGRTRIPQKVHSPRTQTDVDSSPTSEMTVETTRSSPIIDALQRRQAKAAAREASLLSKGCFERVAGAQGGSRLPIVPSRIAQPVQRLQPQKFGQVTAITSKSPGSGLRGIPAHPPRDAGSSSGDHLNMFKVSRTSPSAPSSKVTKSPATVGSKHSGVIASTTRCTVLSSGLNPITSCQRCGSNEGLCRPDRNMSTKVNIDHDPWAFIRDIDASQSRRSDHSSRAQCIVNAARRSSGDHILDDAPASATPKGILKKSKSVRFEGVVERTTEGPVEDSVFSSEERAPSPFPHSLTHAENLYSVDRDMDGESDLDYSSESGQNTAAPRDVSVQRVDEEEAMNGPSSASLESEVKVAGCSSNLRMLPLRVSDKVNEACITPQQPAPHADESQATNSPRKRRMRWASFDASESKKRSSDSSIGGLPRKMSLTPLRNIFKFKAT